MTELAVQGVLAIVSGPSGVGKSTMIGRLLEDGRFALSVSATTRGPRPDEEDGVAYFFLEKDEFDRRIAAGDFVEHATVHGESYGTLWSEVNRLREAGRIVILDIDVQGGRSLRGAEGSVSVFIAPPDEETLVQRLTGRGTETEEKLRRRIEAARAEMAEMSHYDHVVVNDDLDRAASELKTILVDAASGRTE